MNDHSRLLIACIFVVALLPRLLFAFAPHPLPFSDMEDYDRTAVNFLTGHGLAMSPEYRAYRAPGYPLFLVFLYTAFGRNLLLVRVVQAILSAGSSVLLFLLGRSLLANDDRRWMRVGVPLSAGLGLAVYEPHIFLSGVLLSETLFVFLLLGFILLLCAGPSEHRLSRFAAPLLLGFLSLIRPVAATYLPALWAADWARSRNRRSGISAMALSLVLFLVPLVPWAVRNAVVLRAFVPLSTNAGVNFYIGHHPGYSYWSTGEKEIIRARTDLDEVAESRLFFQEGFTYIFDHPMQTVLDTWTKLKYLFRPGIPPWPIGDHGYDLVFPFFPGLRGLLLRWNWLLLVLFPVGAVLAWIRFPKGRPVVVLAGCHIAATLCFFARSRFRVPLEPLFLLWAGLALLAGVGWTLRRAERGRRRPGATAPRRNGGAPFGRGDGSPPVRRPPTAGSRSPRR